MSTNVRLGKRGMLGVALGLVAVMIVLWPIARSWDTQDQRFLALLAVATLAVLAGYVAGLCRQRAEIERSAGKVLLIFQAAGNKRARAKQAVCLAICFAWMMFECVMWSHGATESGKTAGEAVFPQSLMATAVIPPLLTRFWWGLGFSSVEVCECGLIIGALRFSPFSEVRHYRQSQYTPDGIVFVENNTTWNVEVPAECRAELERLLESQGVSRAGGSTAGAAK